MNSQMPYPWVLWVTLVFFLACATGCSDDREPLPNLPGGGSSNAPPGGGTSANGSDPDAGDDAGDDVGEEPGPVECDLEPSDLSADPTRPCCFDDNDCWQSDAPQADQMFCYHSDCDEGLQGVCRVPPDSVEECWDLWDCPEGQICPYEMEPSNLDCEDFSQEFPDICIDE